MTSSRITFYGGAGTVTGANFLLEINESGRTQKILIDCGILQERGAREFNMKFDYDPSDIDIVIVTHAHADHSGRVPKLVRDGFRGVIYSTDATKRLSAIMFEDALKIMGVNENLYGYDALYNDADAEKALSLWQTKDYYEPFTLGDTVVNFLDAGHILGSAMIELKKIRDGRDRKIVFTGDVGNSPAPLLRDTDKLVDVNFLIMESVYGNRNHEDKSDRVNKLAKSVFRAVKKGGTLLIPAFSIQRTQIIIYELNKLVESGKVPQVPVFLDSPLALKVMEVYRDNTHLFNDRVKKEINEGDDIFSFPNFVEVCDKSESDLIPKIGGAKIIIAGSGMSAGGRILMHEKTFLGDKNNEILFVGYQAVGTLGRQIQDGNKEVFIPTLDGKGGVIYEKVHVKAKVSTIRGFSAHKDGDNLVKMVEDTSNSLEKVFVTMGEPSASLHMAQRLRDNFDIDAIVPNRMDTFEIDF